jgi:hypothetical protein
LAVSTTEGDVKKGAQSARISLLAGCATTMSSIKMSGTQRRATRWTDMRLRRSSVLIVKQCSLASRTVKSAELNLQATSAKYATCLTMTGKRRRTFIVTNVVSAELEETRTSITAILASAAFQ